MGPNVSARWSTLMSCSTPISRMSSFVRTGTTMALAALGSFAALCPGEAQATELALATDKQERAPGILKKGIYADVGVRPGTMLLEGGVIPMFRLGFTVGGALNTRFKLGTQFGITAYLDRKKRAVGGFVTVLGTGYVWKGLYLRGGLGVASNIPVSRSKIIQPNVRTSSLTQKGIRHIKNRVVLVRPRVSLAM